jgi:hypothetical protein
MRDLLPAALLLVSVGCAHMTDPCDDKPLARVPSPDGTLVLTTYHRECRSNFMTVAAVEKPAGQFVSSGDVVCHVMAWRDRHPIDAEWKGNNSISLRTTDRLEQADVQYSKDSCAGISVTYSLQFRDERQAAADAEVLGRLKQVVADLGPCIQDYYKGNPADGPVAYMHTLITRGEHRSALESLLGYAAHAGCPLSASTYDALNGLSQAFDLKPGHLAGVASQVKR